MINSYVRIGEKSMKVLVDADACPVKKIIEKVSKEYQIPVIMIIDTSHILYSDYSTIITVSQGADAVDIALINRTEKGDIVVTQDYGVATMALGKQAVAIHHNGKIYTDDNIDQLLFERHLSRKQRKAGIRTSIIRKRSKSPYEDFESSFRKLCQNKLT